MRPAPVLRSTVVLKTSTLLHFHKMLIQQKYRLLFSPSAGSQRADERTIDVVIEMKRRNRTWGCICKVSEQSVLAVIADS
jgi:hypothetical protein